MKSFDTHENDMVTRDIERVRKVNDIILALVVIIMFAIIGVKAYIDIKNDIKEKEKAKPYIESQIDNIFDTYYYSDSLGE